jgi:Mg2+/Co2+ transporter CorB
MESSPLSTNFIVLAILLVCSGFFSMAETAMMASNRHRLRIAAKQGNHGAKLAILLLSKTDKLLGVILLGNTLLNAASATLTGYIALRVFGGERWALEAGTLFITFCQLVFSEITPKVVGATHPEWLAQRISYVLVPMQRIAYPAVWFVNLFVQPILKLLRLDGKAGESDAMMSPEELRAIVIESGQFIPKQHRTILLNLFDLEDITVEDIMTPRGEIEAVDMQAPMDELREQVTTGFHSRILVYDGEPGNVVGILQLRRLIDAAFDGQLTHEELREVLVEPYFIPASTPVYDQLQFFRENRQRLGLVVDEYGELLGLVTLEDIIEELIGKFTTGAPDGHHAARWDEEGNAMVDGARTLRSLNRELGLELPLDGPKTLNGLILEHFEDIPESGVSVRIAGVAMEIVQTQDRRIKVVKVQRPAPINTNDIAH